MPDRPCNCDDAYACTRKAYRADPEGFERDLQATPRDLDPENPYVGPQDREPVGIRDFVPLLIGLAIIVTVFLVIA